MSAAKLKCVYRALDDLTEAEQECHRRLITLSEDYARLGNHDVAHHLRAIAQYTLLDDEHTDLALSEPYSQIFN